MSHRPRVAAAPTRIQVVDARKQLQAPCPSATGRDRGRARQEARLRVGPRCGELVDVTLGTMRPFELDHIVPLWQGGEDTDANSQCRCVTYDSQSNKLGCHVEKTAREAKERFGAC